MLMRRSFALALSCLGACVGPLASAKAADMGYAPPPHYSLNDDVPVQIGNGWYLRGDVGWSRERPPVLAADTALAAAIGVSNGWSASLGAGYQFNKWFRSDLTLDYRNELSAKATSAPFSCVTNVVGVSNAGGTPVGISALTGDCVAGQDARFKRTGLLLNGYFDLGTWAGVTPYVGAGAGVTYAKAEGVYDWYTRNNGTAYAPDIPYPSGFPPVWVTGSGTPTTAPPGFTFGQQSRRVDLAKAQTKFTWALMAGVSLDVAANTKIDLSYRFVNTGSFAPGGPRGDGKIHEYRMGVRYMLD